MLDAKSRDFDCSPWLIITLLGFGFITIAHYSSLYFHVRKRVEDDVLKDESVTNKSS